jgi:hypothetical protein
MSLLKKSEQAAEVCGVGSLSNDEDADTWTRVSRLNPEAAAAAATAEAVQLWTILEVASCAHSHPLPKCADSCLEEFGGEGWRKNESTSPPECDAAHVGLLLSAALEKAGRRQDALAALERAKSRAPNSARVRLSYAKLLFRAGKKIAAGDALAPLVSAASDPDSKQHSPCQFTDLDQITACDALYIAGWVKIHGDAHSQAYTLWAAGSIAQPDDVRLSRQAGKVHVWGNLYNDESEEELKLLPSPPPPLALLVPDGKSLPPALSLFSPSQGRSIAFISPSPLISATSASFAITAAEEHVVHALGGVWGTVRNASVPTTDVAVEDIPILIPWLRNLLRKTIYPFVSQCFPHLADDTLLTPSRLRVHDAFIVRYDVATGSTLLPEHSDTSAVSLSIALNNEGENFEGGGLTIRALRGGGGGATSTTTAAAVPCRAGVNGEISIPIGHGVAFAGPLRHGGAKVTRGTRFILVLFLFIENFEYGTYIDEATRIVPAEGRDDDGGYVVYRETKSLMEALETSVTSVFE